MSYYAVCRRVGFPAVPAVFLVLLFFLNDLLRMIQTRKLVDFLNFQVLPRPGSVVVERSPGMWEVGGSISGRVKQKALKFEVLLLCLPLSITELVTHWPSRRQDNGMTTRGVVFQWTSTKKTGRGSDLHKTGPVHTHHIQTRPCLETKPLSLVNPCFSRY